MRRWLRYYVWTSCGGLCNENKQIADKTGDMERNLDFPRKGGGAV